MQMIFIIILQGRADGVVTREEVECGVLKDFETNRRCKVHRDIRKFVREEGVFKDIVLEKVVELIGWNYRIHEFRLTTQVEEST